MAIIKRKYDDMLNGVGPTRSFLHDELITIVPDGCHEPYRVSKALLCHTTSYFTKALSNGFAETESRRLRVPGCDAQTFELFMHYVADRELPPDMDCQNLEEDLDDADYVRCVRDVRAQLIKLWVFGDYCGVPSMQNAAMFALIEGMKVALFESRTIKLAFDSSAEDSVLRRVFVDEFARDTEYTCEHAKLKYTKDFFDEVGEIKGFLYAVERQRLRCGRSHGEWPHLEECFPSTACSLERYMVPEMCTRCASAHSRSEGVPTT
jgi:hypothetical protein